MPVQEVISPVGTDNSKFTKLAPVLDSVEGKTAGFHDSMLWPSFGAFLDRLGELLEDRYHPKAILTPKRPLNVVRARAERDHLLHEWAPKVDYAVLGLAA